MGFSSWSIAQPKATILVWKTRILLRQYIHNTLYEVMEEVRSERAGKCDYNCLHFGVVQIIPKQSFVPLFTVRDETVVLSSSSAFSFVNSAADDVVIPC